MPARSIPACAGEPHRPRLPRQVHRVYPRVCGGTNLPHVARHTRHGLSPRVRGNPGLAFAEGSGRRSIPACAGEPVCRKRGGWGSWVYPRVCGGTWPRPCSRFGRQGLSPRVRGNRNRRPIHIRIAGSIPACAGEPGGVPPVCLEIGVYPRVCGGTGGVGGVQGLVDGLSPRVRGNRGLIAVGMCSLGSIPACAGEPTQLRRCATTRRVYPRVCGGTNCCFHANAVISGLSPRVRGNQRRRRFGHLVHGSIPACAGEP